MTIFIYVVVIRIIMMPPCPYFILSTPLSLNMWNIFRYGFPPEDKRGLSLGELIRPFASCFISIFIALWAVITHYVTILMSVLSYTYVWAGKGANIRDLFCIAPKVLKLHGSHFQNI